MNFTNFRDLIDYIDENGEDEDYFLAISIILIFLTGNKNCTDYSFDEFVDGVDTPKYIDTEYVKSVYKNMPDYIIEYIKNLGGVLPNVQRTCGAQPESVD